MWLYSYGTYVNDVKVKEPIAEEYPRIKSDQVLFTYFHYAADETLTMALLESGAVSIAYETVQLPTGELPLLTPMSEVAGRMAIQEGAKYLEKAFGGLGILLGGVPGVKPAEVAILGSDPEMRPGMSCLVEIEIESLPDATYVPVQSVHNTPAGNIAFVVLEGGRVEARGVEVGRFNDLWVQVLDGLEEGETVLLQPPPGFEPEPPEQEAPGADLPAPETPAPSAPAPEAAAAGAAAGERRS